MSGIIVRNMNATTGLSHLRIGKGKSNLVSFNHYDKKLLIDGDNI